MLSITYMRLAYWPTLALKNILTVTRTERGAFERGQGPVQTSLKINLMEVGPVSFCRSTSCLSAALQSNRRRGTAFSLCLFSFSFPGEISGFQSRPAWSPVPAAGCDRTSYPTMRQQRDWGRDSWLPLQYTNWKHHPPGADLSHQSICRCALSSEPIRLQLLHPK